MSAKPHISDDAHDEVLRRLEPELGRIGILVAIAAGHREGKQATGAQKRDLVAAHKTVGKARTDGLWQALTLDEVPDDALAFDVLAATLFPMLWPSKAFQIQGLQPGITDYGVSQAVLHEILMLSPGEEGTVHRHLSPTSPLIHGQWVEIEGNGPTRLLRPGPRLIRKVLGEEGFGALPAGISLVDNGETALPDMILQPRTAAELDEVVALAKLSLKVQEANGKAARGGPAVLLTGPPGTGKSLAARHLSRRIGRPLFQLNLGVVVSKWLGQTERNLTRVFEQMAGTQGCILIDECDALLGRRVSIKEGRDHYVNLTVSHLLMLLERHHGPVWLTSNLRANLDDAYIRRFGAVVDFRRPDAKLRQRAWLAELPEGLAKAQREELAALAAGVDLSVAEIANASHFATALAEADGRTVGPGDLARAVQCERTKSTTTFSPSHLGRLEPFLDEVWTR